MNTFYCHVKLWCHQWRPLSCWPCLKIQSWAAWTLKMEIGPGTNTGSDNIGHHMKKFGLQRVPREQTPLRSRSRDKNGEWSGLHTIQRKNVDRHEVWSLPTRRWKFLLPGGSFHQRQWCKSLECSILMHLTLGTNNERGISSWIWATQFATYVLYKSVCIQDSVTVESHHKVIEFMSNALANWNNTFVN